MSNEKERAIVHNAKTLLGNTASLFSFSGGDCSLINTVIDVLGSIKRDKNEHEDQQKHNKINNNYEFGDVIFESSRHIQ